MTYKQFGHIHGLLEEWRAVRNISVEDQKKNFKVNYTKELIEFFEAERDNNEYEMIDAICDMMVVAINAGRGLSSPYITGVANISYEVALLAYDSDYDMGIIELCSALRYYGYDPYQCLLETIKELNSRTGSWSAEEGKWIKNLGAYTSEDATQKAIKLSGRKEDEIKGVDVTISSEGSFYVWMLFSDGQNESYYIDKWYKADYRKCKNG